MSDGYVSINEELYSRLLDETLLDLPIHLRTKAYVVSCIVGKLAPCSGRNYLTTYKEVSDWMNRYLQ